LQHAATDALEARAGHAERGPVRSISLHLLRAMQGAGAGSEESRRNQQGQNSAAAHQNIAGRASVHSPRIGQQKDAENAGAYRAEEGA